MMARGSVWLAVTVVFLGRVLGVRRVSGWLFQREETPLGYHRVEVVVRGRCVVLGTVLCWCVCFQLHGELRGYRGSLVGFSGGRTYLGPWEPLTVTLLQCGGVSRLAGVWLLGFHWVWFVLPSRKGVEQSALLWRVVWCSVVGFLSVWLTLWGIVPLGWGNLVSWGDGAVMMPRATWYVGWVFSRVYLSFWSSLGMLWLVGGPGGFRGRSRVPRYVALGVCVFLLAPPDPGVQMGLVVGAIILGEGAVLLRAYGRGLWSSCKF